MGLRIYPCGFQFVLLSLSLLYDWGEGAYTNFGSLLSTLRFCHCFTLPTNILEWQAILPLRALMGGWFYWAQLPYGILFVIRSGLEMSKVMSFSILYDF